jgi:hypothetical protein
MSKLRKTFLLSFITLLLISACKDKPAVLTNKIKGFTVSNENGEVVASYDYGYDTEGRLIFKSTPLTFENIFYDNQHVSEWDIKFDSGEKETITSKYLFRKAKYYDWEGTLDIEISFQYSINDDGLPVSATRVTNGTITEIKYEYQ